MRQWIFGWMLCCIAGNIMSQTAAQALLLLPDTWSPCKLTVEERQQLLENGTITHLNNGVNQTVQASIGNDLFLEMKPGNGHTIQLAVWPAGDERTLITFLDQSAFNTVIRAAWINKGNFMAINTSEVIPDLTSRDFLNVEATNLAEEVVAEWEACGRFYTLLQPGEMLEVSYDQMFCDLGYYFPDPDKAWKNTSILLRWNGSRFERYVPEG